MDVTAGLGAPTAYAALAALPPGLPVATARELLLRRLVSVTSARHAQLWVGPGRLRSVAAWPAEYQEQRERTLDDFDELPGTAHVRLRSGDRAHLVVTLSAGHRTRREPADTANCLMVLHHRETQEAALRAQSALTAQLAGEVLDVSRRLAGIRDLERRRLGAEIAAFSQGRLDPLQVRVQEMLRRSPEADDVSRMRADLEMLTGDFRTMVRGIHSQVLHRQGLRAALAEVHTGTAQVTGTVPARIEPKLTATLYYLTAAALRSWPGGAGDHEIAVERRSAGLQVTLTARVDASVAELRAALTVEADRIATVGGRMDVARGPDGWPRLVAWVPDRLEPVASAALAAPGGFPSRVRALAMRLVARYAETPGAAGSRYLLCRLDQRVQLGVLGASDDPWVRHALEVAGARQDLQISIAEAGPCGPDIVLRPGPGTFDVVLPGAGTLLTAGWDDLSGVITTEVVARTDLLRARSALVLMLEMVRADPPPADRWGSIVDDLDDLRFRSEELGALEAPARP